MLKLESVLQLIRKLHEAYLLSGMFHNIRWTNFRCWAHSRTFGLTIAYDQSAHRSARSKISVQWWFRILKDRHSPRYNNKLIPRRPTVWRTTATSVDLGDDYASCCVYSS